MSANRMQGSSRDAVHEAIRASLRTNDANLVQRVSDAFYQGATLQSDARSVVWNPRSDEVIFVDTTKAIMRAAALLAAVTAAVAQPTVSSAAALVSAVAVAWGTKVEAPLDSDCGTLCLLLSDARHQEVAREDLRIAFEREHGASQTSRDEQFERALNKLKELEIVIVEEGCVRLRQRVGLRL